MTFPTGDGKTPQPSTEETSPPVLTPVSHKISDNILGFYAGLPALYQQTTKTYPLMIYFHGGGQYGNGTTDLNKVLQEGVPKLINEKKFPASFTVGGQKLSFIVIAPQFVRLVNPTEVDKLITYIVSKYRVDSKRIYLAGFSLGARMLTDYAGTKPAGIAAITAMGGLPALDRDFQAKCKAMADSKLPIWQFHNVDDQAWPYSEAVRFNQSLNSYNPVITPKFTSFAVGQGRLHHDCWTRTTDPAYRENGMNIYEWMLSYTR